MKKEFFVLLIALFFVQLVACERNGNDSVLPNGLDVRSNNDTSIHQPPARYIGTLETNDIKQKTATIFSLYNATSQDVTWKADPDAEIYSRGIYAYITFQKPGPHRIYAINSTSLDTTFIDVTVAKYYEQHFHNDDELFITPYTLPDSSNKLELRTITKRSYECLNNLLMIYQEKQGNTYHITFDKVETGNACTEGEKKAENSAWIITTLSETDEGNIEITFKNKIYKGSFKRKGASYEFEWGYQSEVIFTTKKI